MKISEGNSHYLELSPSFTEAGPMPAVYMRAKLASNGFRGSMQQVAFEHAELARFILDLENLERERRGSATLSAMSPHELDLKIEVIDRPGHVLLTTELTRYLYEAGRLLPHHIFAGFELDPTRLPAILRDFREVLAFRCPRLGATFGSSS